MIVVPMLYRRGAVAPSVTAVTRAPPRMVTTDTTVPTVDSLAAAMSAASALLSAAAWSYRFLESVSM